MNAPSGLDLDRIAEAVTAVRRRVDAATCAARRDPSTVTVVGVAKWHPAEAVQAARQAGLHDIGENYAQELAGKAHRIDGVRWHFIGRLQRNKVRLVLSTGALVHSLDSVELARALGRQAQAAGRPAEALVQVEVDNRAAAHGIRPADLPDFLDVCRRIEGLHVRGLMAMPAYGPPEVSRVAYAAVASLRDHLLRDRLAGDLPELSMGMSHDFETAIVEGATMVRVGTAIFGPRPTHPDRDT